LNAGKPAALAGRSGRWVRRVRALTAPVLAEVAGSTVLRWAGSDSVTAVRAPGPAALPDLVVASATLLAWCLLTWLSLGVLLSVVLAWHPAAALRGVGLAVALTPRGARRTAAVLLGVGLVAVGTSAAPALADGQLDGWSPDRPAAPVAAPRAPAPAAAPAARSATPVVVHRGDTLWAIAARRLPPTASAAAVAASWPRWYAVNRRVIGADPDLILPGQILRPPADRPG
jgi:nucleoid-associated protein YgaU